MPLPGLGQLAKNLAAGAGKGLLDGVKGVIGTFVTDPTKKMEAEAKLQELALAHEEKMAEIAVKVEEAKVELQKSEDQSITARWASDMASDSWLSKNTRPLIVLSLLAFLFIIVILDSSIKGGFEVKDAYVTLLESLLITAVVAYFGSRGVEKFKAMHETTKITNGK